MRAVVTSDSGGFIKLGDSLLEELRPKKLPKPETDAFTPYRPKPKKNRTKYYRRSIRKVRRGF